MRDKFLLLAGFPGSLITFRKQLITALLNEGLELHVAAPGLLANESVMAELNQLGVITHDIPMQRTGMNPIADISTLLALWVLMRKIRPKYFLGYTIKPVIYGNIAAWLARVPKRFALITGLGFTFVGDGGGGRGSLRALAQGLYKKALKYCHMVFFQNPDDEALFRQLNIVGSAAVTCVVNGSGVDVAQFDVVALPEKRAHFLLIARLLGDKGVREYVDAAGRVKRRYPDARFDLVGWIDANPNAITQSELDSWVAGSEINFLGRLSDVRPALSECSVYVLPSYREGTPRTVLEAMSMGRAVITTDAPGCRETVVDGYNGFLVPVKDADALSAAMLRFIEQPELVAQMGKHSRLIAEDKYDVHKVNAEMLKGMGL